jgi:hypothetical protein
VVILGRMCQDDFYDLTSTAKQESGTRQQQWLCVHARGGLLQVLELKNIIEISLLEGEFLFYTLFPYLPAKPKSHFPSEV